MFIRIKNGHIRGRIHVGNLDNKNKVEFWE